MDPLIGRQEQIVRVVQILGRRTKNKPSLIGEPGVGKTAIAEGLAQRIASGDVPKTVEGERQDWFCLHMSNQMKKLITTVGKKAYTFVMGRPNPAKLSNFPEVILIHATMYDVMWSLPM